MRKFPEMSTPSIRNKQAKNIKFKVSTVICINYGREKQNTYQINVEDISSFRPSRLISTAQVVLAKREKSEKISWSFFFSKGIFIGPSHLATMAGSTVKPFFELYHNIAC